MIDLNQSVAPIRGLIRDGLEAFHKSSADDWNVMALHADPCNGWVSISFDTSSGFTEKIREWKRQGVVSSDFSEEFNDSVPDFAYFNVQSLDFSVWREEYWSDSEKMSVKDSEGQLHSITKANIDIDTLVYKLLASILKIEAPHLQSSAANTAQSKKIGIEILGGNFVEFWELSQD